MNGTLRTALAAGDCRHGCGVRGGQGGRAVRELLQPWRRSSTSPVLGAFLDAVRASHVRIPPGRTVGSGVELFTSYDK